MATRLSPAMHPLNRLCAALVAAALVAGCSKDPSAQQAAPADASAPMDAQNGSQQMAPAQGQAMPLQGSAPRPRTGTPVDPNARVADANNGAGADGPPSYDADDGQSGGPESVVSAYIDPPIGQPAPVAVDWAPPPMLVEELPPQPGPDYVWTGGYWAWQGRWIWSAGRWSQPPRPQYEWREPYYEHRQDRVVYVPGYWSAPHTDFIVPAVGIAIMAAIVAVGVHHGHAPDGPQGCFVPPPPGSRPGIIVPAPIGTPPAVVIGAPPVINVGMRIEGNVENNSHNRTINDHRVTNHITNITNVRNVTIVAPAGAMANGHPFQSTAPAQGRLAAAQAPVVRVTAPQPASRTAIPAYQAGHPLASLPPAQPVRREPPPQGAANAGERAQPPAPPQPGQPPRGEPPAAQRPGGEPAPGARPGEAPRGAQVPPPLGQRQGGPLMARPDPGQTPQQLQQAQAQQRAQQHGPQAEPQRAQATQQAEQQRTQQAQQQRAQQGAQQHAQEAEQQRAQQQRTQQAEQQRAQPAPPPRAQQAGQPQRAQEAESQRGQAHPQPAEAQHAPAPHEPQGAQQKPAEPARGQQGEPGKSGAAPPEQAKEPADRAKQQAEEEARRAKTADKTTEENRK